MIKICLDCKHEPEMFYQRANKGRANPINQILHARYYSKQFIPVVLVNQIHYTTFQSQLDSVPLSYFLLCIQSVNKWLKKKIL